MGLDKEKKNETREPDLPLRGKEWERGFTIEENRVTEYLELYESIGYEVRVEPATPEEVKDCQVCFKADFNNLRTIYIRRNKIKNNELDLEEILK